MELKEETEEASVTHRHRRRHSSGHRHRRHSIGSLSDVELLAEPHERHLHQPNKNDPVVEDAVPHGRPRGDQQRGRSSSSRVLLSARDHAAAGATVPSRRASGASDAAPSHPHLQHDAKQQQEKNEDEKDDESKRRRRRSSLNVPREENETQFNRRSHSCHRGHGVDKKLPQEMNPHPKDKNEKNEKNPMTGDVYVLDQISGEQFHLTVALQGPHSRLTRVSHHAIYKAAHNIIMSPPPLSSSTPQESHPNNNSNKKKKEEEEEGLTTVPGLNGVQWKYQLACDGRLLRDSETEMLRNGAVVLVYLPSQVRKRGTKHLQQQQQQEKKETEKEKEKENNNMRQGHGAGPSSRHHRAPHEPPPARKPNEDEKSTPVRPPPPTQHPHPQPFSLLQADATATSTTHPMRRRTEMMDSFSPSPVVPERRPNRHATADLRSVESIMVSQSKEPSSYRQAAERECSVPTSPSRFRRDAPSPVLPDSLLDRLAYMSGPSEKRGGQPQRQPQPLAQKVEGQKKDEEEVKKPVQRSRLPERRRSSSSAPHSQLPSPSAIAAAAKPVHEKEEENDDYDEEPNSEADLDASSFARTRLELSNKRSPSSDRHQQDYQDNCSSDDGDDSHARGSNRSSHTEDGKEREEREERGAVFSSTSSSSSSSSSSVSLAASQTMEPVTVVNLSPSLTASKESHRHSAVSFPSFTTASDVPVMNDYLNFNFNNNNNNKVKEDQVVVVAPLSPAFSSNAFSNSPSSRETSQPMIAKTGNAYVDEQSPPPKLNSAQRGRPAVVVLENHHNSDHSRNSNIKEREGLRNKEAPTSSTTPYGKSETNTSQVSAPRAVKTTLIDPAEQKQKHLQQLIAQQLHQHEVQRTTVHQQAADEQERLLRRLRLHMSTLDQEKQKLLRAQTSMTQERDATRRLLDLRAAQEVSAAREVEAARARLGAIRDALRDRWLRIVHDHSEAIYCMPHDMIKKLESDGDHLAVECVAAIAAKHAQQAKCSAAQVEQQKLEMELRKLQREEASRRSAREEEKLWGMSGGPIRTVVRLRPESDRAWLPASCGSAERVAALLERNLGYAVTADATLQELTVTDPPRGVRRRYRYDGCCGPWTSQNTLFVEQVLPVLELSCRRGTNTAYLTYGATGSGKTYTLLGHRAALAVAAADAAALRANKKSTSNRKTETPPPSSRGCGDEDNDDESALHISLTPASSSSRSSSSQRRRAAAEGAPATGPLIGISSVEDPTARVGISRTLPYEDAVTERRVVAEAHAAATEADARKQAAAAAEERAAWGTQAGLEEGDGLIFRAATWLVSQLSIHQTRSSPENALSLETAQPSAPSVPPPMPLSSYTPAQLRDSDVPHHTCIANYNDQLFSAATMLTAAPPAPSAAVPPLQQLSLSMYEVYNDHIYDLLPAPVTPAEAAAREERPRWDFGWMPPPHIKNHNPEHLPELELQLAEAPHGATAAGTPRWAVKATELPVQTVQDAITAIESGLQRRRTAATLRNATSSRSHLFVCFHVVRDAVAEEVSDEEEDGDQSEKPGTDGGFYGARAGVAKSMAGNEETEKERRVAVSGRGSGMLIGASITSSLTSSTKPRSVLREALDLPAEPRPSPPPSHTPKSTTRKSTSKRKTFDVLFCDLAGSERVELGKTEGDRFKEAQYINKSLSALGDVMAALVSAAAEERKKKGKTEPDSTEPQSQEHKNKRSSTTKEAGSLRREKDLVRRWATLECRQPMMKLTRSSAVLLRPLPPPPPLRTDDNNRDGAAAAAKVRAAPEGGYPLRRRVLDLLDDAQAGASWETRQRLWRAPDPYIPFRACKLTQLMQSVLLGAQVSPAVSSPCTTVLLACLSPCSVAEVVLPDHLNEKKKSRKVLELASTLFRQQVQPMLSEVQSTLAFVDRAVALDG